MRLEGKRIIITGGAGGIGQGTLRAFVREGAQVAVLDIQDEVGKQAVAEANEQGDGNAVYYHCDVSIEDEVNTVFAEAIEMLSGLDVLAHLAGINYLSKSPEEYTLDEMNKYWANNLNGTILCNQAAYRQFQKENKGVIINFASDEGISGSPYQSIYSASKSAVLAWTRSIAMAWAPKANVRSNSVCPTIKTALFEAFLARMSDADREKFLAVESTRTPLGGSMGDSDKDMAPVMVFLASDDSHYINGQIISVNGGRNMLRG